MCVYVEMKTFGLKEESFEWREAIEEIANIANAALL